MRYLLSRPSVCTAKRRDLIRGVVQFTIIEFTVRIAIKIQKQIPAMVFQREQDLGGGAMFHERQKSVKFGQRQFSVAISISVRKDLGQELEARIIRDLFLFNGCCIADHAFE